MVLFWFLSCNSPAPDDKSDPSADVDTVSGLGLESLRYRLEWDTNGVSTHPEGGSLFENDGGYSIWLKRGYVVDYSLRLYPCEMAKNSLLNWLIPSAYAGHSDFDVPSNWPGPWVESLHSPVDLERGPIYFESERYCEGVYTIARGDLHTENRPEDIDMNNRSIWLEGEWTKGERSGTFQAETTIPAEAFAELSCSGEGTEGLFTVRRSLSGLFDGLDMEVDDADRLARLALLNLARHATLSLHETE